MESAVQRDWTLRPQKSNKQEAARTCISDRSSRDYVGGFERPRPAHLSRQHVEFLPRRPRQVPPLVTVSVRSSSPYAESNFSSISVDEVKTPSRIFHKAQYEQAGTYASCVELDDLESGSLSSNNDEKGSYCEQPEARRSLVPTEIYAEKIATKEELQALQNLFPLPPVRGSPSRNRFRYKYLSCYRELMVLVFAINIAAIIPMIICLRQNDRSFTYENAATATGANLLAAVMMRQEHVINTLFHLVCALPNGTPLWIRRQAAKAAYSQGGIHSAAGLSAMVWYILYIALLVRDFTGTHGEQTAIWILTSFTMFLFTILTAMANPPFRRTFHNVWELSHRFSGWTAIALIWAQLLLTTTSTAHQNDQPIMIILLLTPTFWLQTLTTILLLYPWIRLRRLPITAHNLSSHATELRFPNRKLKPCAGITLSHNPLLENHKFATIARPTPTGPQNRGFSVLVSNAGDWTQRLIASPPTHIWVRGGPITGMLRIASLFIPLVLVATGSGIGPCLSFLNTRRKRHSPCRIIWSARSPEETYGRGILEDVLRADRDAVIVDTRRSGHPDLVGLAFASVRSMRAEAVVVVSNPRVTKEVVFQLEVRGVPAFGAIFDS
ncbi:hypothetical protein B0A50_06415 [Salinomyces thailandicus]|uniref:Integral membrane protein TmpA n=1 Tax=Salinomyces thailandicus TaxID=706561 RepID=A0A4U0TS97_9PEZI|nr:hypothetical protein B0A50_06415 [Salinomyces thailandica]